MRSTAAGALGRLALLAGCLLLVGCSAGLGVPSVTGGAHRHSTATPPISTLPTISMRWSGAEHGRMDFGNAQVQCQGPGQAQDGVATLAATAQVGELLNTITVNGLGPGQEITFPETSSSSFVSLNVLFTSALQGQTWAAGGAAATPGSGSAREYASGNGGTLDVQLDPTSGASGQIQLSGTWSCA
ncbi:MAG: hypothetical protein ACREN4_00085 [Candidatus Dormibacteria bacterium]